MGLDDLVADVTLISQESDLPELKAFVEGQGFSYQTIELNQIYHLYKRLKTSLIFFDAVGLFDAESNINGLRKNVQMPIAVLCKEAEIPELEKRLSGLVDIHYVPRENLSSNLPQFFDRFKPALSEKLIALVYSEDQTTAKAYKDTLSKLGFTVRTIIKSIKDLAKQDFLIYKNFKIQPKVIILDGNYVRKVRRKLDPIKLVRKFYPEADIISICEAEFQKRALTYGDYSITRPAQGQDDAAVRQGIKRFVQKHLPQKPVDDGGALNNCFILAGPSCSGKTTAAFGLREDERIVYCIKHTTRPRRRGEIPGETFIFVNNHQMDINKKKGVYFVELPPYKGYRYAIPKTALDALKSGKDVLVTTTSIEMISNIAKAFEKVSDVVPILFYANLSTLEERLCQRASLREARERLKTLPRELETFLVNANNFKHAVDTTYTKPEESTRIVKAIIEWERHNKNKPYVDTITSILFGPDFFIRWMNEKMFLQFDKDFLAEYAKEKEILYENIEKISKTPVAIVCPRAYGRASVFFETPKDVQLPSTFSARDVLLDLIERKLATDHILPRHRNNIHRYDLVSLYGACEIISISQEGRETPVLVNDGLFYRLGDELVEKQADVEKRHAISFGFIKYALLPGYVYQGVVIKKEEVEMLHEELKRGLNVLPNKNVISTRSSSLGLISME